MILDRLETLAAILFIIPAIPKDEKTGKNCLFVRVDGDNLILVGGNEFVIKKSVLAIPNTTEGVAAKTESKKTLPKTFMVPLAELLGFKEMIKAHKVDCKKLGDGDENKLFVEIDHEKLISHNGIVDFKQPKFGFKDLETIFQITKSQVSEMPVMSGELEIVIKGFQKSKPIEVSFSGHKQPVHFKQGDFEAIMIPPVEKEETETEIDLGKNQLKIDE